jgi:hypothetical protein
VPQRVWSIARATSPRGAEHLLAVTPWAPDAVVGWAPGRARILALTVAGARSFIPRGLRLARTDHAGTRSEVEWWADAGVIYPVDGED